MSGPTTTRGACNVCKHRWSVPRTSVHPANLRQVGGISYVKGLPICCPRCSSVQIAWLLDDPSKGPSRPTRA